MGKVFLAVVIGVLSFVLALPQMLPDFMQSIITASDLPFYSNNYKTDSLRNAFSMRASKSLNGFSTGDPKVDRYIVSSSSRYNIDPLLIYVQMNQESGFKQTATSHKGASGLMQLMPDTAKRFGVTDIYDPEQNVEAGVRYMRWLIDKFDGDVRLALAGYNAGEGAVIKSGNRIPPYRETFDYVTSITIRYSQIRNQNNFSSASVR